MLLDVSGFILAWPLRPGQERMPLLQNIRERKAARQCVRIINGQLWWGDGRAGTGVRERPCGDGRAGTAVWGRASRPSRSSKARQLCPQCTTPTPEGRPIGSADQLPYFDRLVHKFLVAFAAAGQF